MATPDDTSNALLAVALKLASTRSLDDLLPVVLERAVELLGAERALFALFDEDGQIEEAVLHNLTWQRGTALPISNRIVSEVLQSRAMRTVVNADPDRELTLTESIRQHGLRFILAVPVIACGRVSGVLYADSKAPVLAETLRRSEVLRALAGLVGVAVENLRLLEEQRLRTVLLGKLVHDLKSPLLAVVLGAEVARDALGDVAHRAVLDDLLLAGRKMQMYCESALGLAGIESATPEPERAEVDLGAMIDGHARLFRRIAPEYRVDVATRVEAGLPAVYTWADRVGLALDNLLFNAIKHAESGSDVVLAARPRPDAGPAAGERPRSAMASLFRKVPRAEADPSRGFVEVSVHNRGEPIDPALMPRIFDEWVRGEAAGAAPSTGLGLAIVDQCVRSLGGRVWVESSAGEGTTFRFTVPVAPRR